MPAFLINPANRTVTEINFGGTLEGAYQAMGCDLVDIVRLPHGNMLIVDDEGLLKPNHVFTIEGYPEGLAGKSLIVGDNNDDFKQAPTITLDQARQMVGWTNYITRV